MPVTVNLLPHPMRIDAHHHFWKYDPAEYGWICEDMRAIRRDFLPEDLRAEIRAAGVDGVVSVQARQTLEETAWLLELAEANDFIRGVVGWLPLAAAGITAELERFAASPKLRGVRHVLQGEADERYMLRQDFNAGVRALRSFGLVYDLLIFERQLPQTIEFVDRHPAQVFVLDHVAKPRIKDGVIEPWNRLLRELAKRESVFCKLSGMVTEADWSNWNEECLRPYADAVLESFGADRVMFGSDWPVCLAAGSYGRWAATARHLVAKLSSAEQAAIFGGTATRAYILKGKT